MRTATFGSQLCARHCAPSPKSRCDSGVMQMVYMVHTGMTRPRHEKTGVPGAMAHAAKPASPIPPFGSMRIRAEREPTVNPAADASARTSGSVYSISSSCSARDIVAKPPSGAGIVYRSRRMSMVSSKPGARSCIATMRPSTNTVVGVVEWRRRRPAARMKHCSGVAPKTRSSAVTPVKSTSPRFALARRRCSSAWRRASS
mmetsp:Transcript_53821/g.165593  ORF Transcript_53821/g.165593 Transcript_53821/m.165593 type:complete len:201 (+) Transcript_53821:808-1410(+)